MSTYRFVVTGLLSNLSLLSIVMAVLGLMTEGWWTGFGIVLFMTSTLGLVAFTYSPIDEDKSKAERNPQASNPKSDKPPFAA